MRYTKNRHLPTQVSGMHTLVAAGLSGAALLMPVSYGDDEK